MTRQDRRAHSMSCAILLLVAFSLCFAYVIAASSASSSANVSDPKRLIHDVIDQYDHRLRPVVNQTKPVDVYFTIHLLGLLEIDEVQQRIHINAWVNFSWWDEVRVWNPEDYNGIDVVHPDPLDIWRPRTIIANSIGPRDIFADDYAPLSILHTGSTVWAPGAIFYLSCEFDLTYFPFDTQTCSARFIANDLATELNIIPTLPSVVVGGYTVHGEWELKSTSITKSLIYFGGRPFYVLEIVSLICERRPTYYLLNVLSPVMVLSFLSLLGFVVPKESGERVSFSITVLLSLAVFMGVISGQLPPSSDTFPYISIYIFSQLCLSGFSVFIIVCQLRLASFFSSGDLNGGGEEEYEEQEDYQNQEPEIDVLTKEGRNGHRYEKRTTGSGNHDNNKYKKKAIVSSQSNGGFVNVDASLGNHGNGVERSRNPRIPHRTNQNNNHILYTVSENDVIVSARLTDNQHDQNHLQQKLHGRNTQAQPPPSPPSSSSSSSSTSSWKTNCFIKVKSIVTKLFSKYDDLILFVVFTTAWIAFTAAFFGKVMNKI